MGFYEDSTCPHPVLGWNAEGAKPEPSTDNSCADLVLDLHKGLYLTQLTDCGRHADIHCQLTADLKMLNFDLGNGRIIEFPLAAVNRVFRPLMRWNDFSSPEHHCSHEASKHIVMVEFVSRKLAFLFEADSDAQCFMTCIQMLKRRAHEHESKPAHSTSQPTPDMVASSPPRMSVGLEERWLSSAFSPVVFSNGFN